jgi:rhodanese-related sulfurtransferase
MPLDTIGHEVSDANASRDEEIIVYCGGPKCPQSLHAAQKLMDLGYTTNDSTTGLLPKYFPSVTVSQARANAKII